MITVVLHGEDVTDTIATYTVVPQVGDTLVFRITTRVKKAVVKVRVLSRKITYKDMVWDVVDGVPGTTYIEEDVTLTCIREEIL
jgi:hypothetical protein